MSAASLLRQHRSPVPRRLALVTDICDGLALLIAAGVAVGWLADVPWLTTYGRGIPLPLRGVLAAALLGLGLVVPGTPGRILGLLGAAAGALSLLALSFSALTDLAGPAGSAVGAGAVVLLGACRVLVDTRWAWLVEWIATFVGLVGCSMFLSYLYGVENMPADGPFQPISFPATIAVVLMAVATLSRVYDGLFAWVVLSHGKGARVIRRSAPWALVGLPILGYVRVHAVNAGRISDELGVALVVSTALVGCAIALAWVSRSMDAAESRRQIAVDALAVLNVDLESRVQDRADQLEVERGRYAVLNDRQRIAADMHDHVIQGLYAVALTLESAKRKGITPEQLDTAVRGVDAAIRDLRTTIYDLKHEGAGHLLEDRLTTLTHVSAPGRIELTCTGPVADISDAVAENLLASVREAISNAIRHGRAEKILIEVRVTAEFVTVVVEDDGVGMDEHIMGTSGMKNIRSRAERYGGSCRWEEVDPQGTRLVWASPCHPPRPELAVPDPELVPVALGPEMIESIRLALHRHASNGQRTIVGAVANCVADIMRCDLMMLLADRGDSFEVIATAGLDGPSAVGRTLSKEASLSGQVMQAGHVVRIENLAKLPTPVLLPDQGLAPGPGLLVPLGDGEGATGVLALGRSQGQGLFSGHDVRLARTLSSYVDLAVEMRTETTFEETGSRTS